MAGSLCPGEGVEEVDGGAAVVSDYAVAEGERLVGGKFHFAGGDDAGVEHSDVAVVVPEGFGVVGVVDDGEAGFGGAGVGDELVGVPRGVGPVGFGLDVAGVGVFL